MEGQLEELRSMMEGSGAALVPFVRELKVVNPEEKSISSPPSYCNRASNTPMLKRSESNREFAFASIEGGSFEAAQVSTQGEVLKKLSERLDERSRFSPSGLDISSERICWRSCGRCVSWPDWLALTCSTAFASAGATLTGQRASLRI
jgi:hypothetical protein